MDDIRSAKQRRQELELQLDAARAAEDEAVRPKVETAVEALLDQLEVAFCNGEARKAVTAAVTDLLTRLIIADKADMETTRIAADAAMKVATDWPSSARIVKAPWS